MAHHIAELIAECEAQDDVTRRAAKERCAAAVLELWSHRASLTGASKPFQDLAPIIETLRALNPDGEHLFYRRTFPSVEWSANEETKCWLNFAKDCDAIARMLIAIGIDKASEHAGNAASEWADAASKSGLTDLDTQISDFLDQGLNENARTNRRRIEDLKNRIAKLDAFSAMASALRADFQKMVVDLESADHLQSETPE
ncbi:MAG: hypothetical protein JNL46_03495 [Sphingosinicella sp.]|nr:hypothetical protein [Sphingosinicella sp.]